MKSLSNEYINNITPTKGFNVKRIEKNGNELTFWDLGGQSAIRYNWESYYDNKDGLIYVIDSSDNFRLYESGTELKKILEQDQLGGLPLLIFANKQDLNLSLSAEDIINELNLCNLNNRKWNVMSCSALKKTGIKEGIDWLYNNIVNQ